MIEDTILYNGEITLRFDSGRHTYRVINKGKEYKVPSVTRITGIIDKSAPLMAWAINNTLDVCKGAIAPGTEYAEVYLEEVWKAAKQASQQIKQDAADKGKSIHSAVETSLKNSDDVLRDVQGYALSGRIIAEWMGGLGCRPIEIERRIYSRRQRYSGTLDCIGEIGSQLYLLDWKSGKHIYPEFRLQTAAYVLAWEEEHPDQPIQGRYIVRIAEDGSIEPHFYPRSTLRKDISAFLGAKRLFDQVQAIEKEALKAKKQSLEFQ